VTSPQPERDSRRALTQAAVTPHENRCEGSDGTSFPEHNIGEECAEVGEVPRLKFRSKIGVPPFYGASSPKRRLHTLTCALGWQRAATDDAG
jgi:hypothetical protein